MIATLPSTHTVAAKQELTGVAARRMSFSRGYVFELARAQLGRSCPAFGEKAITRLGVRVEAHGFILRSSGAAIERWYLPKVRPFTAAGRPRRCA